MQPNTRAAPLGYGQITVDTAVNLPNVGNPASIPSLANVFAVVIAEAQDVRMRDDGTDPTASSGMLWKVGIEYTYSGNLSKVRVIGAAAGGKLNVSYYVNAG